jgi:polyphenol oxidase
MPGRLFLVPDWPAPPGIRALTTQRRGGASRAPYKSMNLGDHVGDEPAAVDENRRLLAAAAHLPASPCWLRQVHGTGVVDLDVTGDAAGLAGDAAITTQPGRVCAVLTADCLPVLFTAADGSAVAAAHAGWRGLAAGVLEATSAALAERIDGPVPVIAWLGPAISPAHFEVGDEVREAFVGPDEEMAIGFIENARGRWQCDLYTIARRILLRSGVADVFGGEHCTFAATERFFSHRRDARPDAQTGRMATLIWREP